MLNCCNLPGNNLLSRFCFQNYFPCPNSHFRPCFIALCSLFLDFTSYPPPTIKTPFVYKALKSSNLPHISDALFFVFEFVSIFFLQGRIISRRFGEFFLVYVSARSLAKRPLLPSGPYSRLRNLLAKLLNLRYFFLLLTKM